MFAFYYGRDEETRNLLRRSVASIWKPVREACLDYFTLFVDPESYERDVCSTGDVLGAVSGYVRHDCLEHVGTGNVPLDVSHNRRFLEEAICQERWPLGRDWTGSFAAVGFSALGQKLVLCNDLLGWQPLYLAHAKQGVLGATNLLALGRCRCFDPDPLGILQRISPGFCNYGRRTLLRGVARLLPGEWRKFSLPALREETKFDNSLCNGLIEPGLPEAAREVWDCLQCEIFAAASGNERIHIAMSGGWDSRHLLAGLAHRRKAAVCLTCGSQELYETRLARRCAESVGAEFHCFANEGRQFPPRNVFERLVEHTESANYLHWWAMLDGVGYGSRRGEAILLGDMCESIQGRNIATLSSRHARKHSYLAGLIRREAVLTPATASALNRWKGETARHIEEAVLKGLGYLAPGVREVCRVDALSEELREDLDVSFSRVSDNLPPFAAMFDELFGWFHKARYPMAGQCLLVGSTFRAFCPPMSMRFLRLISMVHPRLRLHRRLLTAIARLPEFDRLAGIPSAQIPWVGARAPLFMRLPIWGARSGVDQWLIRRRMKSKDSRKPARVLKSFDWPLEYRQEGVLDTVRKWFSGQWILPDSFIQLAKDRGDHVAWPFTNADIAAVANVSTLLDLCKR